MKILLLLTTFILSFSTAAFSAPITALSFTGGTAVTGLEKGNFGWQFTTSNALDITHLGFFDLGGDGFFESHEVGIFNLSGGPTPLIGANIDSTDTLDITDSFRYEAVTYRLNPGSYIVGGFRTSSGTLLGSPGGDAILANASATTAFEIIYNASRYNTNTFFSAPLVQIAENDGFFGANFKYETVSAVPTPNVPILLVYGLGIFFVKKRPNK